MALGRLGMDSVRGMAEGVIANVEKVIVGKHAEVQLALVALMCQGHVLIEDVPGVGKTMLAKALAKSVGCTFKRVQFTPDLLPSDITGVSIYNQKSQEFEYRPGPVITQILLADEINRATPKTQSALLEAMEERQVTVDGETHPLPGPFMVLATQNPIEYEGTFPLPEAQLDRFLLRITLGYPSKADEITIIDRQQFAHPIDEACQVMDAKGLALMQDSVKSVYVDPAIRDYIVSIVEATRDHADVFLGASPRGSLGLFRAGQAWAALQGREYVSPGDVKLLAISVLAHRLIVSPAARVRNLNPRGLVEEVLDSVPAPAGKIKTRI
jgi:MoxR-like ATPase